MGFRKNTWVANIQGLVLGPWAASLFSHTVKVNSEVWQVRGHKEGTQRARAMQKAIGGVMAAPGSWTCYSPLSSFPVSPIPGCHELLVSFYFLFHFSPLEKSDAPSALLKLLHVTDECVESMHCLPPATVIIRRKRGILQEHSSGGIVWCVLMTLFIHLVFRVE